MTSRSHPQPLPFSSSVMDAMKLEFIPVREKDGPRKVRRRRGSLRLYLILWDAAKAPLSGGYTLAAAPTV